MKQTSFWHNSSPKDTECFIAMCANAISEGEICVGHFTSGPPEDINVAYGLSCAQCGMKYAKKWKCGPLPAQWDQNGWGIAISANNKHPNYTPQSQCPACKTLHRWPPKQHYYCEVCENASLELVDIEAGTSIPSPVPSVKAITYISFSYKQGVPTTASRIFDVRQKVRNPWRDPILRKLNGLHPDVQSFVLQCKGARNVLKQCLPYYTPSGHYVIGCQGGKHRSVALVELAAAQARAAGWDVTVIHRDLNRKTGKDEPTKS